MNMLLLMLIMMIMRNQKYHL